MSLHTAFHNAGEYAGVANIICGAGVLRDSMLVQQARAKYAKMFQLKVDGSL